MNTRRALFLLFLFQLPAALAQQSAAEVPRYLATIELHTTAELYSVLVRTEQLLEQGSILQSDSAVVTFVLHGAEVTSLLRQNYRQNKETVDLAARLSALGVVRIQACETWMGGNLVVPEDLQPFVGTVNYGPSEVSKLVEEGYLYF
ncbi:MAG: intracellular sulfur oxidation DsrE/DsrF family protein [Halioglobus sp.]